MIAAPRYAATFIRNGWRLRSDPQLTLEGIANWAVAMEAPGHLQVTRDGIGLPSLEIEANADPVGVLDCLESLERRWDGEDEE